MACVNCLVHWAFNSRFLLLWTISFTKRQTWENTQTDNPKKVVVQKIKDGTIFWLNFEYYYLSNDISKYFVINMGSVDRYHIKISLCIIYIHHIFKLCQLASMKNLYISQLVKKFALWKLPLWLSHRNWKLLGNNS